VTYATPARDNREYRTEHLQVTSLGGRLHVEETPFAADQRGLSGSCPDHVRTLSELLRAGGPRQRIMKVRTLAEKLQ
jgi:hypothetical protein